MVCKAGSIRGLVCHLRPGSSGQPVPVAQGNSVRNKIQFFESGAAIRGAPAQSPGVADARAVIPKGRVQDRIGLFESGGPARPSVPSPGAAEAQSVIPKGLVQRRLEQFDPARQPDTNAAPASSTTTLSIATDINTAVLIAAAILVAIELIQQRRDLQKAQQRARLHRFRDLNQEIKRFDRSKLNAVNPQDDDDDSSDDDSSEAGDVNADIAQPLADQGAAPPDAEDAEDLEEQEDEEDEEEQEDDSSNEAVVQATASTREVRRRAATI